MPLKNLLVWSLLSLFMNIDITVIRYTFNLYIFLQQMYVCKLLEKIITLKQFKFNIICKHECRKYLLNDVKYGGVLCEVCVNHQQIL